jgi:putative redox protein
MHEIKVSTRGGMRVEATDGVRTMTMDEPADLGGNDAGLTPTQTLVAALGGCTALTLKLYSARKSWPLEDVKVTVQIEPADRTEPGAPHRVTQTVELIGPLDEAQRERLLLVAGKCPVHKLLEGPSVFEERLVAFATEA